MKNFLLFNTLVALTIFLFCTVRSSAQETYGNGSWNGYVYQSPNPDVPTNRFGTYLGVVTEPATFTRPSTANAWTGTLSSNFISGTGPLDYFAVRYKMTYNFPCGDYNITIPNVDDAARLSIDGGQTWMTNLCAGYNCGNDLWNTTSYHNGTYTATAYLSGPTNLVLEFFEAGGNAAVGFAFTTGTMNLTSSNLNSTYFDLNFGSGTSWNIKVSTTPLANPATGVGNVLSVAGVTTNPYPVTGLTPGTLYYVYAQAACGGNWSHLQITTSAIACIPPTELALNGTPGQTSASIIWNPSTNENELGYLVKLGLTGIPDNVVATTYNFTTGLTSGTNYTAYVSSACAGGSNSIWVAIPFTTASAAATCLAPTYLAASNTNSSSTTITWLPGGSETEWMASYNAVGYTETTLTTHLPAITLSGLEASTSYHIRIKAICGATDESGWSSIYDFSTAPAPSCPPPYLQINNINATSATLTWTSHQETCWEVCYKPIDSPDFVCTTVHTKSFLLDDLSPNTPYQACLTALCVEGVDTTRSQQVCLPEFTTLSIGITPPALDDNVKLYPNPTTDLLTIDMSASFNKIEVTDLLGQVIYTAPLNTNLLKLDVADYTAGVYFVKLQSKEGVVTKKFVKK